jgi:Fungal trichothecene efflux pump (TRI12)
MMFLLKIHTPKTALGAGLKAIDWTGSLLIVGGIVMLLLGLQFGGVTYPWTSAKVICLIVFGVVSLVLFAINEWRVARYPIIPLHIFKYRSNIAVLLTCFCHGYVFIGGSYYLPFYWQAVLGHGPILSGVYLLAYAISLSLLSVSSGLFIRATGRYQEPIWFGMILLTVGFGLFILLGPTENIGMIIGFQIVAGIGTGPNFQAPLIALQTMVPPRDIAAAVATFQLARNVATSVSIVIGSVVFQNALKHRKAALTAAVGADVANQLAGFNAAASTGLIQQLPDNEKAAARVVLAESLKDMWIMYTAVAFIGLLCSLMIAKKKLEREHTVHKTGLAMEEEKRNDRLDARKASKAAKDARKASVVSPPPQRGSKNLEVEDVEAKRVSGLSTVTGDDVV